MWSDGCFNISETERERERERETERKGRKCSVIRETEFDTRGEII